MKADFIPGLLFGVAFEDGVLLVMFFCICVGIEWEA